MFRPEGSDLQVPGRGPPPPPEIKLAGSSAPLPKPEQVAEEASKAKLQMAEAQVVLS